MARTEWNGYSVGDRVRFRWHRRPANTYLWYIGTITRIDRRHKSGPFKIVFDPSCTPFFRAFIWAGETEQFVYDPNMMHANGIKRAIRRLKSG